MARSSVAVLLLLSCLLAKLSTGFNSPNLLPTRKYASPFKPTLKRISTARPAILEGAVGELATSLFRSQGQVPFLEAFGINAFLFAALSSKLSTMLTPSGLASSFVLGTGLWMTLGWKGWSLCVIYLFFGQAVTKVKFAEKEKMGIAEKRGGQRGPENVW